MMTVTFHPEMTIKSAPYYDGQRNSYFVELSITGQNIAVYGPIDTRGVAEEFAHELADAYQQSLKKMIKTKLKITA